MHIKSMMCSKCLSELKEMGLIYSIYIDLCIQFVITEKPLTLDFCECCKCRPIFNMIFELESRRYIKLMEKNDKEILVVPNGVFQVKDTYSQYFACICGECYE